MSDSKPPMDDARKQTIFFAQLVELLTQNAVMMLGVPDRSGRQRPPDLASAEVMIEILSTLQKKTKGNLTKEEERMISGTLYQLQTAFAEVASKSGEFEKARKATEATEAADAAAPDGFEDDFEEAEPAPQPGAPRASPQPQAKPQGIQSTPGSATTHEKKVKFTKKYV